MEIEANPTEVAEAVADLFAHLGLPFVPDELLPVLQESICDFLEVLVPDPEGEAEAAILCPLVGV
ncbi:hypothetical protein [Mangrovihabitans endophyticus]|uniref:Uncharacterized protein n=1 Tax=Mangrovihabitans endophyticus TaxID=1751298 RepID=A0A8J3FRM0_9ACTN|nr:hypothetical protein [Mangrovihabitans endophyticus]GGL12960.1 hypothetical protein GCM10012284_54500 [Mangrovihabitans endophyticus]